MIEDQLLQYGVLGLWTISLIVEKVTFTRKMMILLQEIRDLLKRGVK